MGESSETARLGSEGSDASHIRYHLPVRALREGLRERMFQPGTGPLVVGRFHVLGRIGAGGMGIVHAAYDPSLDRKVALKLLATGRQVRW